MCKLNPIIVHAAAILFLFSLISSVEAGKLIILPGADYSVTDYHLFEGAVPGPNTYNDPNDPISFKAILAATPTPSIYLQMKSSGPGTGAINASIIYDYHISGPATPSGLVRAQVTSQLWAKATGGDAGASLVIPGIFPNGVNVCASSSIVDCGTFPSHLSVTASGYLPVDGEITLSAVLDGNTLSAFVDPAITVPIGYAITFSEGIGNTALTSVPEPSTWAMMLVGLAGLGFAGWRKAKSDQAALSAV